MKEISKSLVYKAIYLAVIYLLIFIIKDFELTMILSFIPFLVTSILFYSEFLKSINNKKHVMLSKSNFDFWNLGFSGLIIAFCLTNLSTYTGVLLLLVIVHILLDYTVSKRRILFIDKEGINELGKNKFREIREITSLEIHPNNVEFRFNEYEILQINKNELVQPKWNDFVKRITEIKSSISL